MKVVTTLLAAALALTACNKPVEPTEQAEATSGVDTTIYQAVVAHPDRTEADRARDAGRKPAQVMEFFGIEPGMQVLDLFSGGGYYTELLSRVVGPEGQVVAHTNSAYAQFVGDEAVNRYADDRLPNVSVLVAENNELDIGTEVFDATMMILAYHDIYYVAPNYGWPKIDGPLLLAEVYTGLKPGGVLAIVDHYAEAGAPRETGNTLHRVDPGIVIDEVEAAGFVLDGKSDVLRNTEDDHTKNMADPSVRGKTDRFVLRFRKPVAD